MTAMFEFCRTALTSITGADLPQLEQEREVLFVYVYDENTPEDNIVGGEMFCLYMTTDGLFSAALF